MSDDTNTTVDSTLSNSDTNEPTSGILGDNIDTVTELHDLCYKLSTIEYPDSKDPNSAEKLSIAIQEADERWDDIRTWIRSHPDPTERTNAAEQVGKNMETALHLICRHRDPPLDVLISLLDCCPDPLHWPNSQSWIPLHFACANGASCEVIEVLVEGYPDGAMCADQRGRTPLHFAVFHSSQQQERYYERQSSSSVVSSAGAAGEKTTTTTTTTNDDTNMINVIRVLTRSGAAEMSDEKEWSPLHYACAFGTSIGIIEALLAAYPEGISGTNGRGQTALHMAMVNAKRCASPEVVNFLLTYIRKHFNDQADEFIVQCDDDGHTAVALLANEASVLGDESSKVKRNVTACLQYYLDCDPPSSTDFFTSLQSLPDWIRYPIVVNENVQRILNEKIAQPFPTFIYLLDFYMLCMLIIVSLTAAKQYVESIGVEDTDVNRTLLILLYIGISYFFIRETLQIISVVAVAPERFKNWCTDTTNLVDVLLIVNVLCLTLAMNDVIHMDNNDNDLDDKFRYMIIATILVLWLSLIFLMKSFRVEFAVFVDGVVFVLQRLFTFLLALFLILICYTMAFLFQYMSGPKCILVDENTTKIFPVPNETYVHEDYFAHCHIGYSFLRVYSMLMGEVEMDDYTDAAFSQLLYVSFAFIVVVLLSNVLIAIVTDSYAVIQNERAEMVFWNNRLDFVTEMTALSEGSWRKRLFNCMGCKSDDDDCGGSHHGLMKANEECKFQEAWKNIMSKFDVEDTDIEYWRLLWTQCLAVFIISIWMIVGFASMGLLLPPQIREKMFIQERNVSSRKKDQVVGEIARLKNEIEKIKNNVEQKMSKNNAELEERHMEIEALENRVVSDLSQIKEVLTTILNVTKSAERERWRGSHN